MIKESDFLLTAPDGIPCWRLEEHEPLLITLFPPVFSRRNYRGPWKIKRIYWAYLTAKAVDLECKRE